jgi:MFS transporter, FHS family, glucose/mannose:H+ symporter
VTGFPSTLESITGFNQMPAAFLVSPGKKSTNGIALIHVDFVLTGIVMTLLGPLLPILSARWSLNDAQAGHLFTAQFVSSMFGMLLSGISARRFGYRITLIYGLVGMAGGIALLAGASWLVGLIAVSIFGAAFGLTTPSANLLVADTYHQRSAGPLSLLNSSWGVGALACPLILAAAERSHHTSQFLYATAFCLAALAVYFSAVRFAADDFRDSAQLPKPAQASAGGALVIVIAALFFIYVGTETCMGGWIATYAHRIDSGSRSFWAVTPSFFWGALLAGRIAAPIVLRRVRETTLATAGVFMAALGIVILLATPMMLFIVAGATIAGLGLASVYPINVSLLSHRFEHISPRISGFIFAMGTLGGAVLPWIVGAISTRTGSLRWGFVVPLLGTITMLLFYLWQRAAPQSHSLGQKTGMPSA